MKYKYLVRINQALSTITPVLAFDTVDGSEIPNNHLGWYKNPINNGIIPQKCHFEDDFPFPKVGYVNPLEGTPLLNLVYIQLRGLAMCSKPAVIVWRLWAVLEKDNHFGCQKRVGSRKFQKGSFFGREPPPNFQGNPSW